MSNSGTFRTNPLQTWQREAILSAAQLLRDRFGNPPADPQAKAAHDGLLEVLDPARRTVRMQREQKEAAWKAAMTERTEQRAHERRAKDRRKANLGPPPGMADRRKSERRSSERRNRK